MDGKNALQTQAYGAEARGSLTRGEVIISSGMIGFPAVRKSDVLVAMNQESLDQWAKDLKDTGTLIVDSSNVTTVPETKARVCRLPISETAKKDFGEVVYANMVMLGALTRITRVVSEESVERAIMSTVPERTTATNVGAFKKGLQLKSS
jgi:2-oxoglutarate ferredoxin oxidoreductase subunit gamma